MLIGRSQPVKALGSTLFRVEPSAHCADKISHTSKCQIWTRGLRRFF
jgi:hypothetical protein